MDINDISKELIQPEVSSQELNDSNLSNIPKCLNCGAALQEEQEFCHKCGMKKGDVKKILCLKCGAEVNVGQKFCPMCGNKTEIKMENKIDFVKKKFKKHTKIICISAVIIVILFVVSKTILPQLLISTSELLAQGDYERAYQKANEVEKVEILKENLLATLCNEIIDEYKDPSSFELRDAWFDEGGKSIVIRSSGKNSYGGVVSSYNYFIYDEDEDKFSFFCNLSSLVQEEYSRYDTTDELAEKLAYNVARSVVSTIIEKDECKIRKSSISNINNLVKQKKIDEVQLLQVNADINDVI